MARAYRTWSRRKAFGDLRSEKRHSCLQHQRACSALTLDAIENEAETPEGAAPRKKAGKDKRKGSGDEVDMVRV